MPIEPEPRMVISNQTVGQVVIEGPEDLVKYGISIHSDTMIRNWGPDAVDRYHQAKAAQNGAGFEISGSINFRTA